MQLITKVVPKDFNLFLCSCTHWGSVLSHDSGTYQLIDSISHSYADLPTSRNLLIHHGDIIEGIKIDDKRFQLDTMSKPIILPQLALSVERLSPIKKHIICVLQGNHEQTLWGFGNMAEEIAKQLGVPYGTCSSRITYIDPKGNILFKHFATHGRKLIKSEADDPVRQEANMKLTLKRHLKNKAGDCILASKGHTHRLIICPPSPRLYLTDDCHKIRHAYTESPYNGGYIHPDDRWYVNAGAFYKLYELGISSYAEQAEYDPIELGFAVALVRDGKIREIVKEVVS